MSIAATALAKFLESPSVKGAAVSFVVTAIGFVAHQYVRQNEVDTQLSWHSKAITDLRTGQDLTHNSLEAHSIILERIEGKLDVVNQKIDDDRNYAERHQVVATR